MLIKLTNGTLNVEIAQKGAELHSIKSVADNHEYLWQGDVTSWNKHAPILFPIIGGLNNNTYTYNGSEYALPPHGFANKMEYEIIEQSDSKVVFSVSETKETLKVFPFCFQLMLGYELEGDTLKVTYKVINKDSENILFSIGGHPGFNCPLEESLSFTDYKLTFNKKENSQRRIKCDGVLTGERRDYFNNNSEINLELPLFSEGALIFDDLNSDEVCIESDKGSRKVTMNFNGFPYMGFWTKGEGNSNYICLEPWFGLDSTKTDSPEWTEKEGLIKLDEGEEFNSFYTVKIS